MLTKIKTEQVKETWFDELQTCCYEKLQNEDRFLPAFKRSVSYLKLLAELDLLKDPASEDDSKSLDSISLSSINNELDTLDEHIELQRDGEKSKSDGKSELINYLGLYIFLDFERRKILVLIEKHVSIWHNNVLYCFQHRPLTEIQKASRVLAMSSIVIVEVQVVVVMKDFLGNFQ